MSMRPRFLLLAVLPLLGCASGSMNIWVADEGGRPIPGVIVTVGEARAISTADGLARFPEMPAGDYRVDAEDAGYKSCGPLPVTVEPKQDASVMLVMRVGTLTHETVAPAEGDTATYSESRSQLVFKACPGRPDSAVTLSTPGAKKVRKP